MKVSYIFVNQVNQKYRYREIERKKDNETK